MLSLFFFTDPPTTEIYTLSLHDALPILISENMARELWREPTAAVGKRIRDNPEGPWREIVGVVGNVFDDGVQDRKSTRLNSSHSQISYAVFCLKKKKRNPSSPWRSLTNR